MMKRRLLSELNDEILLVDVRVAKTLTFGPGRKYYFTYSLTVIHSLNKNPLHIKINLNITTTIFTTTYFTLTTHKSPIHLKVSNNQPKQLHSPTK